MFSNLWHTIKRNWKMSIRAIPSELDYCDVFEFNAEKDFYERSYYKFLRYKDNYAIFENLLTQEKKYIFYADLEKLFTEDKVIKTYFIYYETITNLFKILDLVKNKDVEFYISDNRNGLPQMVRFFKVKHLTEVKNNHIKVYFKENDRYYEKNLSIYEFPDEINII